MKTFKSEVSAEGASPTKSPAEAAKSKRAALAKKKNYSIYMQPTGEKKK